MTVAVRLPPLAPAAAIAAAVVLGASTGDAFVAVGALDLLDAWDLATGVAAAAGLAAGVALAATAARRDRSTVGAAR